MLKKTDLPRSDKKSLREASAPSAQERHNQIEKEAYLCACARGFDDGDEKSDWLEAEQKINTAYGQR